MMKNKKGEVGVGVLVAIVIGIIIIVIIGFLLFKSVNPFVPAINCGSQGGFCSEGNTCPTNYVPYPDAKCETGKICCQLVTDLG